MAYTIYYWRNWGGWQCHWQCQHDRQICSTYTSLSASCQSGYSCSKLMALLAKKTLIKIFKHTVPKNTVICYWKMWQAFVQQKLLSLIPQKYCTFGENMMNPSVMTSLGLFSKFSKYLVLRNAEGKELNKLVHIAFFLILECTIFVKYCILYWNKICLN